ncbi:hypothetical protein [Streptomyces sp. NPDC055186]
MAAEHDADALMSAITGEPLPDEARADAAFMAEHRRAEADVVLLREQLGMIGGVLADEPRSGTEPAPVRAAHQRRRLPRLALGALALAVVTAVGGGMGWLITQGGVTGQASGSSADAASAQDAGGKSLLTYEGLIACSSVVAEGTVTRVEPAGGNDRYRIVLDVDRHYKPSDGERELAFTDEGTGVPAYYRAGVRMLVLISSTPGEGPESYRAGDPPGPGDGARPAARDALEEGRLQVERALPGSQGLECDGGG